MSATCLQVRPSPGLPFATFLLASVLGTAGLAQSFAVATRAPSGGYVSAPGTIEALFPVAELALPVELRLAPPSGLASFLARLSPVSASGLVGVCHEFALRATDEQGYPSIAAATFDGIRRAPQAFDFVFASAGATPVQGTLRVAVQTGASAFDGRSSNRSEVDVDGDGLPDLVVDAPAQYWPVTRTFVREQPFTLLPHQERAITLWADASVSAWSRVGHGQVAATVRVEFAHGTAATSVTYGEPCGAAIDGWFESDATSDAPGTRRTVRAALHGAAPFAPVLLLFGVDRVQLPIPGSDCKLATTPLVLLPLTAGAAGTAELSTDLPDPTAGDFCFQFLTLGTGARLAGSGGMSLRAF